MISRETSLPERSVIRHPFLGQNGHFIVVQEKHVAGPVQDRRDIGGDEEFALAESDHQGAALARADHHVGVPLVDDGDRVGALEMPGRLADRVRERAAFFRDAVDEMGDHFGVRLGLEDPALRRRAAA